MRVLAFILAALLSSSLGAQSFNAGIEAVNSRGLGFEEWYGGGVIEASGSTNVLLYRMGVEVLDAQKKGQDGWGGRIDVTLTIPMWRNTGLLAFYRPSYIHQTDYSKAAHEVGAGVAFLSKRNGRLDLYYGKSFDDYSQENIGAEIRVGSGHWLRIKLDYIGITQPVTGRHSSGSRMSLAIAPRIKW